MISSCVRFTGKGIILVLLVVCVGRIGWVENPLPPPKPVPRIQIIPMPYEQASFQRDGTEIARYHFGPTLRRPFLFPIIGPAGFSVTRMGHPRDPESHSHHNSVWISHNDVNGVSFWGDQAGGKIRHKRIIQFDDGTEEAYLVADNEWIDNEDRVLLRETRRVVVHILDDSEWLLLIGLELKTNNNAAVTLGKTPFGMIGVRMAKTIGVNDGGGTIRNSEGGINEEEILWKRAKWVDYSGRITNEKIEGVTLFDHPGNPNFPTYFHVRNDGWMGASLTYDEARTIEPGTPLHLRYGLYIHSDRKLREVIEAQWERFANIYSIKLKNLSNE
jgi:hypothetical protein